MERSIGGRVVMMAWLMTWEWRGEMARLLRNGGSGLGIIVDHGRKVSFRRIRYCCSWEATME